MTKTEFLIFEKITTPYLTSYQFGNMTNLFVSKVDIPDINDIDNDGDLDIVAVDGGRGKSLIYKNLDGQLEADETLMDQTLMDQVYNAELFDINNDGYIDLIAGGHDWSWGQNPECDWWECNTYDNGPVIIYGDGIDFINNEFQRLPASGIDKQGIVTNFEFFDFDKRLKKILNQDCLAYVVEPKIDGVAVSLSYEKGKLKQVNSKKLPAEKTYA